MTTTPAPTLAPVKPGRRPVRARSLRPWYRNGSLVAGIVIVGALILVAIFAPVITPYPPTTQNLTDVLQRPSAAHWLGTDQFGRDVFTRLIWSTRVDLRIGFLAVLIPFVVGSILGGLAGYFGGWLDLIVMRLVDIFFAFPFYVMVIALVFVLGAGETSIYLAIATVSWVSYAKIVRGAGLVAKQQDYVMAARLGGFSHLMGLDDPGRPAVHHHAVAAGNHSGPRGRGHQPRAVVARRRAVRPAQPGPEE